MDDLEVTLHPSPAEIGEWNQVAAVGGLYGSAEYLLATERGRPTYLAVRSGGAPVAVAACYAVKERGGLQWPSDPWRLFAAEAQTPALEERLYPLLFCGCINSYSNRLLVRTGLDPAARAPILARLLGAVREVARREGAKLIAFGHLGGEDAQELFAADRDLLPLSVEPECLLGPLTTFEAYLAEMTSARRNKTRREMKRFAAAVRLDERLLGEVLEPLAQAIPIWAEKFGTRVSVEGARASLQRMIAQGFDAATRVFCAWQGELLLGAAYFVLHGRTYYGRNFVIHPEAPKGAAIYFNLNFHEPVRRATSEGATSMHFSVMTVEAKLQRGCYLRPQWFVLGPSLPFEPALREALRAGSRERLAKEAAGLRLHRASDAAVREELALDLAEALHGEPSS